MNLPPNGRLPVILALAFAFCALFFAACAAPTAQTDSDYSALARLALEGSTAPLEENIARQLEERMRSREIADAVLARMDASARKKFLAPYADRFPAPPTDDDFRALLLFGLNVLPPQNGGTYVVIFRHSDPNIALLATQLFAEEITENLRKAPPPLPPITLQSRARIFIVPAGAIPNPPKN